MKAIRREPNLVRLTGRIGCGKSVAVTTFVAALDNDRYSRLVSTALRPLRGKSRQGTLERVDDASPADHRVLLHGGAARYPSGRLGRR